ncbi:MULTISPECIES: hypothetical protein [Actinokineospora]|uniref:Uncharacterized protein n=1 Tax=Actinokineospora fastidiosa TaxID=1816 RepID=A0A918GRB7_9PSEU|nr:MULTISPECIES: hypothetical protein [Actinokineospora]UVS81280.1 hypothetical protein Actkin_05037 [Actinokineospora sp. UTMC 2448]GGS52625.1 hypothetical protein GCM10010171_54620 [Actinokineospora fastidiosa]
MKSDTESQLRALVGRGFEFLHPRDANGELTAVVGVRVHHGVIDVVRLRAEDDALASRMPGETIDITRPARTLWRREGSASEVLGALLALPEDHIPGEDRPRSSKPVSGCWVPTAPGRAKWLPATA